MSGLPMISEVRKYATRMQTNIPEASATQDVEALIEAHDKGEVDDLPRSLAKLAEVIRRRGQGANKLVSYDLVAIARGRESPTSIGQYYREAIERNSR